MKLHTLLESPAPELGAALEQFEKQFTYPLGPSASFSISHGRDYTTFFRAIGEATVLVAEEEGRVLATLAAILRPLRFPDGRIEKVAYLADLKMDRNVRHKLPPFLMAMTQSMKSLASCGYAVVMDGTRSTPNYYTGRSGIPAFQPVAQLTVLTLTTRDFPQRDCGEPWQERRPLDAFVPLDGQPGVRSEMVPQSLGFQGACGLLEDTRLGKRLLRNGQEEMRAAHLSRFSYRHETAAAGLLEQASLRCFRAGIPTLFACLPQGAATRLLPHMAHFTLTPAPATVFACGFETTGSDWWVDSAEI